MVNEQKSGLFSQCAAFRYRLARERAFERARTLEAVGVLLSRAYSVLDLLV